MLFRSRTPAAGPGCSARPRCRRRSVSGSAASDVTVTLRADQVRRTVLGAQGFTRPRPTGAVTVRHAAALLDRVAAIQLDSVNVIARAHELTLFARFGDHPRDLADRLVAAGRGFEFWGHEASIIDVALQPALRWRMEEAKRGQMWGGLVEKIGRAHV